MFDGRARPVEAVPVVVFRVTWIGAEGVEESIRRWHGSLPPPPPATFRLCRVRRAKERPRSLTGTFWYA